MTAHLSEPFAAEPEQLLAAIAASAVFEVGDDARFEDALLSLRWLRASSQLTRALLSGVEGDQLQKVAVAAMQISDAILVTIMTSADDGAVVSVAAACGSEAETLVGTRFPVGRSLCGAVIAAGEPLLIDISSSQGHSSRHSPSGGKLYDLGPCIVVPLIGARGTIGSLAAGRHRAGRPFTQAELLMVVSFANQAALAIELATARTAQESVRLLDDRQRIARDLHDHVIQRLFGTALSLQALAGRADLGFVSAQLNDLIGGIDDSIEALRSSIFQIQADPETPSGLRASILKLIEDAASLMSFRPKLRLSGPLDTVTGLDMTRDVLAVLREAVSNVVRHSGATRLTVSVVVESEQVVIDVVDDGIGIGAAGRSSGLANLRQRAERRGGRFALSTPDSGGTRLQWSAPWTGQ